MMVACLVVGLGYQLYDREVKAIEGLWTKFLKCDSIRKEHDKDLEDVQITYLSRRKSNLYVD